MPNNPFVKNSLAQGYLSCMKATVSRRNPYQIDAFRQMTHIDFIRALHHLHQLPRSIVDLHFGRCRAIDSDDAVGGVWGKGDGIIRHGFSNACDGGRGANGLRLLLAVNRSDAVFHVGLPCKLCVGEVGDEAIGNLFDQCAVAIDAVAGEGMVIFDSVLSDNHS